MPRNFSFVIPGKLAGLACPGTIAPLAGELMQLQRENIGAVVSLTEIPLDAEILRQMNFVYLHLPVEDFTAPTLDQVAQFVEFVKAQNAAGRAVAAHCAGGYGRTGTMLACYLVALGETAAQAIASVRAIRPGSIETCEQEDCVAAFAQRQPSE